MRIPNTDRAVISHQKLVDYLLNLGHRRGAAKARLLLALGYDRQSPARLEADLREQHLTQDIESVRRNDFGEQYTIAADILTPNGQVRRFRSVWQIDLGDTRPRLITMVPL